MKHLSPAEFVDLLDGRLGSSRSAHVGACAECRARAEEVRHALADAAKPQPSDPSPLFWEHFSARVSEAIRHEPVPPARAWRVWLGRPALTVSLAAAIVALVTFAALWDRPPAARPEFGGPGPEIAGASADTLWVADDVEADEAWAIVRAATEGIEWDEVSDAGIDPRPGAASNAVAALTDAERAELARLIEDEMKRTGAKT